MVYWLIFFVIMVFTSFINIKRGRWTKMDVFLFIFFYFFLYALSKLLHNHWLAPNFDHGNHHVISFLGIFLWLLCIITAKFLLHLRQKRKTNKSDGYTLWSKSIICTSSSF